jgi:hypothetical protein
MLKDLGWNLFMKLKEIKKRYCECGRELEYRKRVCSECRQINIDIAHDRYNASKIHRERAYKYNKGYRERHPSLKKLRELREGKLTGGER